MSEFTFEDVGSGGAGVATVGREAIEPVVDDTVVVDKEAPKVTTDDLEESSTCTGRQLQKVQDTRFTGRGAAIKLFWH
jgi:hypothetical protein